MCIRDRLKVLVFNINPGYNEELMQSCRTLREYSEYVAKVREYHKTLPLNHAVQRAVDTCIENGVLKKFLKEHKAEVIAVSIFEYNEEPVSYTHLDVYKRQQQ